MPRPEAPPIVRRATPGDAQAIAELSAVLGYPSSSAPMAERLSRLLAREEDLVLVAEAPDGRVAGWLHAREQEPLEVGPRCEIFGLVVGEPHRGRGTGRALVSAAEQWAAMRGLTQVVVRSNVVRPESHAFYVRLGYERIKTQHVYRRRPGGGGGE